MNVLWLTLVSFTLVLTSNAYARTPAGGSAAGAPSASSWYLEETFFPEYVHTNDTTSVTGAPGVATEKGLGVDARSTFGFAFLSRYFLGASYNLYSLTTERPMVAGGDSGLKETTTRDEWDPTVGYMNSGWRVLFTYLIGGGKKVNTRNFDGSGTTGDVSFKYAGLSGYQVTAGYTFRLATGLELGPSLVYRAISYEKQSKTNRLNASENYSGAKLHSSAVDTKLTPMITVVVRY